MKDTTVHNGDVIIVEHRDVFYLACCECGLTHEIGVKIDPDVMQVSLEVHRHAQRTSGMRRKKETKQSIEAIYERYILGKPRAPKRQRGMLK